MQNLFILILVAQVEGGMACKGGIHGCKSMDFLFVLKQISKFCVENLSKFIPNLKQN